MECNVWAKCIVDYDVYVSHKHKTTFFSSPKPQEWLKSDCKAYCMEKCWHIPGAWIEQHGPSALWAAAQTMGAGLCWSWLCFVSLLSLSLCQGGIFALSLSLSLLSLSLPWGGSFLFLSKIQTWMEWFWFLCTAKAQMYQSGQLDLESVVKTQAAGWHCEMGVWQWPWRPWLQFCAKPLWNLVGNTRNTNNFDLFSARRSDVLVALYPMRSHEVFSKNY